MKKKWNKNTGGRSMFRKEISQIPGLLPEQPFSFFRVCPPGTRLFTIHKTDNGHENINNTWIMLHGCFFAQLVIHLKRTFTHKLPGLVYPKQS
jgi:hypothetical protein